MRREQAGTTIQCVAEYGLVLVEIRTHARVLTPLTAEEERDRALATLMYAPNHRCALWVRESLDGVRHITNSERSAVRERATASL